MYFSACYGYVHARNTYIIAYRSQDGTRRFRLVEYCTPRTGALVIARDSVSYQTQFDVTEPAINHITDIIPVQESSRWDVTDVERTKKMFFLFFFINFPSGYNDKINVILFFSLNICMTKKLTIILSLI